MKLSKFIHRLGWLAFVAIWIPFTTFMVSMLGLSEGKYAWSELPLIARYFLLPGGALAAVAAVCLFGAPVASAIRNRAVLAKGATAQAVILKIWDTGTAINNKPFVRLLLEVQPPGQPAFQAETERLISRLLIPRSNRALSYR